MAARNLILITLTVTLFGSPLCAQVAEPPPRPARARFGGGAPPDPNRTRQELTVSGNLLGGYDDNLTAPGVGEVFTPQPSGYVGFGDAMLRYFSGNQTRSLEASGRGYVVTYRNIGVGPSFGADQALSFRSSFNEHTTVSLRENLRYAPFFSLGVFSPLTEIVGGANPD